MRCCLHRSKRRARGLKATCGRACCNLDADDKSHRLGESWQYGPVVLAWDSSRRGGKNAFDGHNVVLHEFAHQLDQMDGVADGAPTLGRGKTFETRKLKYRSWALVFSREFECFERKAAKGKKTVIDHYGASNPAEFFATATEAFFEKPAPKEIQELVTRNELIQKFAEKKYLLSSLELINLLGKENHLEIKQYLLKQSLIVRPHDC